MGQTLFFAPRHGLLKNDRASGGPGVEAPRPTDSSGWLSKAVQYFNVVLLDQRGTGKSSPITVSTIKRIGAAEAQADYIQHFRSIIMV